MDPSKIFMLFLWISKWFSWNHVGMPFLKSAEATLNTFGIVCRDASD